MAEATGTPTPPLRAPPRLQLLKWVGSKHRFAATIASTFPADLRRYWEPFLGSGSVLAALAPRRAVGSDAYAPLIEIWRTLRDDPGLLKEWYASRWKMMRRGGKVATYERIRRRFNSRPSGADFVFLSRACYGGVIRFRRSDGAMSTPCGAHEPISPAAFARRVDEWRPRFSGAELRTADYLDILPEVRRGELVYCDPPYPHTQSIVYGAQLFSFDRLIGELENARRRGALVALSIDGSRRSGRIVSELQVPRGLFRRQLAIAVGGSMLRRFQLGGRSLRSEQVTDRLLLGW